MLDNIERPLAIKIICALGLMEILLILFSIYTMPDHLVASWYPPYKIITAIVALSCAMAFWHMLKFTIYFYTAYFILNQVMLYQFGVSSIYFMIIPVIIILIGWIPFKKPSISN
ncbi:hypothetical protein [Aurantibacter sp.]|uniref:hypothetical protein n=1 Tax=Aurantibacter sp. TaxID=2807103 RepID=UPI003264D299